MADAPAREDVQKWNRWFAVECNNHAWRLAEQVSRTPAEDEEMVHAAHAATLHWSRVGTELHQARAAMLLGQVHALVGDGKRALRYARESFAFVTARQDTPGWELAFAHAALGSALPDNEERAIFEATFRTVPAP